jgi:hypothetical protein
MHTFILQDWTTIRGGPSGTVTITQHEPEWLDLGPYQDVAAWVDVKEATTGSNQPTLTLQTAPTKDESFFLALTSGLPLVAGTAPTVVSAFMTVATTPLARYLRWQLSGTAVWDATFRIVIAANSPGM